MENTLERLAERLPAWARGWPRRRILAAAAVVVLVVVLAVSCGGGSGGRADVPCSSDGADAGVTGVRAPSDADRRHPARGRRRDRQPRPAAVLPARRVEPDAALHPHAGHLLHRARRHRRARARPGHRPRHAVRGRSELDVHPPRGGAVRERPADHLAGRQVRHRAVVRLRRHRRWAHLRRRPARRPGQPLRRARTRTRSDDSAWRGRDPGRPHDRLPAASPRSRTCRS